MKQKPMSSLERKLAHLSTDVLPFLGTALGSLAGGVGAPIGGALGGMASAGLKGLIPPEQQYNQPMDRPMVIGGQGQGFIDLDQYQSQQQDPYSPMGQFGSALGQGMGSMGSDGLMQLLSLLGQQQPSANQSLMGKMDNTLREKLVRMAAIKQALGS